MATWFHEGEGEAIGPVSENELRDRLIAGAIGRATLVWSEGLTGWTPLSETSLTAPPLQRTPDAAPLAAPVDVITCPACEARTPRAETFCTECGSRLQGQPTAAAPSPPPQPFLGTVPALVVPESVHASFGARVGAYLIDTVVWLVLCFVVGASIGIASNMGFVDMSTLTEDFYTMLSFAVLIVYWTLCESSAWQGTLGKRMLGLRVVDGDGARLGGGHAFGRSLAKLLSGALLFGFLMPLFTRRKQGLHDLMATTHVLARDGKGAS